MKRLKASAPDQVQQWLDKAGRDIAGALVLLREEQPFTELAAFHAQQAAEKYLKALLLHHEVDFPKTHDLNLLLELLKGKDPARAAELRDARILTFFGVEVRYPSDLPEPTLAEARQAVELAQAVERSVRAALGRG